MTQKEISENVLELPSLAVSAKQAISSSFLKEGGWPDKVWWETFEDSKLNALMQKALEQNPSIQSVERKVEFAKQNAIVVRSKLYPLVFFDYKDTWSYLSHNGIYRGLNPNIPLNGNLTDLSLSFTYELDFWSKYRNLFRSALGKVKADEAEAEQVKLTTTTALAQAYFALKTNLIKKKLYSELKDTQQSILDLQIVMKDKALYSILPPLSGAESLQEVKQQLIDIEDEVKFDIHLINTILGQGPDVDLDIDDELKHLPEQLTIPTTLSLDLLSRRPDLMAQIWTVESLAREVGAAKADFYPNINLAGLFGYESFFVSNLLTASSQNQSLIPALNLPIFTAGAIRANIRAKKASFDQAVFNYNQKILDSTKEVADLLVIARSVYEKKQLQDDVVLEAKKIYDINSLLYTSGLDSLFSLYSSRLNLLQKQIQDVGLLYNQYLAAIKLIKSLGGGYTSEFLPIKAMGVTADAK